MNSLSSTIDYKDSYIVFRINGSIYLNIVQINNTYTLLFYIFLQIGYE